MCSGNKKCKPCSVKENKTTTITTRQVVRDTLLKLKKKGLLNEKAIMLEATNLTKSHITQLEKVRNALSFNQKMDGTQLILGESNNVKLKNAEDLINKAIQGLRSIA